MFSVIEKASGRWVGRLGPWQPEDWPGTEVGWGLAREVWGRGYATEGAAACMDYAFDVLGWTEAIHTIEPDNLASQAVAKRLGLRRSGARPGCRRPMRTRSWRPGARPASSGWRAGRPRSSRARAAAARRCG